MIKYNAPELEVITFASEDIITTSGEPMPPHRFAYTVEDGSMQMFTCTEDANGKHKYDFCPYK